MFTSHPHRAHCLFPPMDSREDEMITLTYANTCTVSSAPSFKYVYFEPSMSHPVFSPYIRQLCVHLNACELSFCWLGDLPSFYCSVVCFRENRQEYGECSGSSSTMCVIDGLTNTYQKCKSSVLELNWFLRFVDEDSSAGQQSLWDTNNWFGWVSNIHWEKRYVVC